MNQTIEIPINLVFITQDQIDELAEIAEAIRAAIEPIIEVAVRAFEAVKRAILDFLTTIRRFGLFLILLHRARWLPIGWAMWLSWRWPKRFLPSFDNTWGALIVAAR